MLRIGKLIISLQISTKIIKRCEVSIMFTKFCKLLEIKCSSLILFTDFSQIVLLNF